MRYLYFIFTTILSAIILSQTAFAAEEKEAGLQAGFGEADITPELGDKPVYMAGFGQNRKATAIHDRLMARAIVLAHGKDRIALVSVDVVGLFHASVIRVREKLSGFRYVLVSSTHNHEGPDTLGLWGPNPFKSGIDPDYLKSVEEKIVKAVREADSAIKPMRASIGTANAPELLHDSREPYIKHDELVAIKFAEAGANQKRDKPALLLVQWNCHPETLESKNTQISSDFVGATVKHLQERYHCPVIYFTGTVGGMMTSLNVEVKDEKGNILADGSFEKTQRYGQLVGQLADRALANARDLRLTPFEVKTREVYVPLENRLFKMGSQLGVLNRPAYRWTGDPTKAEPAGMEDFDKPVCLRTEVGWLHLGELEAAAIPGEIYPELVLDKVQDPPDPGADFPDAPVEPAIYKQMRSPHRMMIGLANDEIGYIIPKRQWDEKPPFCYGRKKAQYGESNSVGPDTAPILCKAFKELAGRK